MRKAKGYWDIYENCYEEAKKYKTKKELEKSCGSAYKAVLRHGWMDDYTWLEEGKKPNGYWNVYEHCYEEAKKYKTRTEFQKGCSGAYTVVCKNGWLDDYTWFVDGKIKMLTDKNDSVYKYYWEETNAIYIGRTLISQQSDRKIKHNTSEKDTVFRYAKENGLEVPQMEIIEENITPIEGLEREDYWVSYYKEKGYNVLNKAKTGIGSGSLGAINRGKWNKKTVFEEAKKYKTRSEFQKNSGTAYQVACKNKWLDDYTWFKESRKQKPNGYWNVYENCHEEALKYNTRSEFRKGCETAYIVARKNKWLDDYTWFKESRKQKPNGYWNKETVFAEAKQYKTRSEFKKNCVSAYSASLKNGWIDILFPVKNVA